MYKSEVSRNSATQGWGKAQRGQSIEDQDKTRPAGWIVWDGSGTDRTKTVLVQLFILEVPSRTREGKGLVQGSS